MMKLKVFDDKKQIVNEYDSILDKDYIKQRLLECMFSKYIRQADVKIRTSYGYDFGGILYTVKVYESNGYMEEFKFLYSDI